MNRGVLLLGCALSALMLASCNESGRTESSDRSAGGPQASRVAAPPLLRITQVRADRTHFDPARDEAVEIWFHIDKPAAVALSIYDGSDRRVAQVEGGELAAGEHVLRWDGRDARQRPVPSEAYTYTLTATVPKGQVTFDLTDLTGGEALVVKDVRWDADAGQVRYRLDQPARVNIRFGLRDGGPYVRTLVDWVPRPAGAHSEAWDGWDASRAMNLARHPKLATAVKAYSLPENTVFVGAPPRQVAFTDLPRTTVRPRTDAAPRPKRMYFHADQPLATRGDIAAALTVDPSLQQDAQGRWIVSGPMPIRLDVPAADRARVLQRRFETVFYVDGVYTFESELGYLPTTWVWDPRTVNEGEHFVTTNIRGYEGNFGTATLKVWVKHPKPDAAAANR